MKMIVTWLFPFLYVIFLISTDGAPVEKTTTTLNMEDLTTIASATLEGGIRSTNESAGDNPNVHEPILDVKSLDDDSTTPNIDQLEKTGSERSEDALIGSMATNNGSEDKITRKTETIVEPRKKSDPVKESDENVTVTESKEDAHAEDQKLILEDAEGDFQSALNKKSNFTSPPIQDSDNSTSPVRDLVATKIPDQPLKYGTTKLPDNRQYEKHDESNMKSKPKTTSIPSIETLENVPKTENEDLSMVADNGMENENGTTQSKDITANIWKLDEHWTESTHVADVSNMMKDEAKKNKKTDNSATEMNVPGSKDDPSDVIGEEDNTPEKASDEGTSYHADSSSANEEDTFESKATSFEMTHKKNSSDPEDDSFDEPSKHNWSEPEDNSSDVTSQEENSELEGNPHDLMREKDSDITNTESQKVEANEEEQNTTSA
ncbi:dentin sialophosphoprotein-like [Limulus polyphemus]|uniref:Dentin sialophosphoprotein-like n=1 Tax=Limulus polyphemus TaxID=6850 RepID=A0ABM1BKD3_LIMPO|nr:dentin sialophosphoprotein-like [Limulus polyphemus]